jgi:CRISPR-associated exonuclease Cas4
MILKREVYQYTYCPQKHKLQYTQKVNVPPTPQMVLGALLHKIREVLEDQEFTIIKDIDDITFEQVVQAYKRKKLDIFETAMKEKSQIVHQLSDEDCEYAKKDLDLLLYEKAVRTMRVFQAYQLKRGELAEYVSPPWKYVKYSMKSKKLQLAGIADLIEHFGSFFYPVELKTGKPPKEGIFMQDKYEVGCTALLVEDHFKVPVPVGFIEYTQLGERRPVRIDTTLRDQVLHVRDCITEGVYPEKEYTEKCGPCEYVKVCWDDSNH